MPDLVNTNDPSAYADYGIWWDGSAPGGTPTTTGSTADVFSVISGLGTSIIGALTKAGTFGTQAQNQALYGTPYPTRYPWQVYNTQTGAITNYGPLLLLGGFGIAAILLLRR